MAVQNKILWWVFLVSLFFVFFFFLSKLSFLKATVTERLE